MTDTKNISLLIDDFEQKFKGRMSISKVEFFDFYLDIRAHLGDLESDSDEIVRRYTSQNFLSDEQFTQAIEKLRDLEKELV